MKRLVVALLTLVAPSLLPVSCHPRIENVQRSQPLHYGRHIRVAEEISLPPCGINSDCLKLKLMLREIDREHRDHRRNGHHRTDGHQHRPIRAAKLSDLPPHPGEGDTADDNSYSEYFKHEVNSSSMKVDANLIKEEHGQQGKSTVFKKEGALNPKLRQRVSEGEQNIAAAPLAFQRKGNHRQIRTIDASYYGGGMFGGNDEFYDYDYDYDFLADPSDKATLEEYYEEELAKEERNIARVGYDEATLQTLTKNDETRVKGNQRKYSAETKNKGSKKTETKAPKKSNDKESPKTKSSKDVKDKDTKTSKKSSNKTKGKGKKKGSKSKGKGKSSKKKNKSGKSNPSNKEDSDESEATAELREWSRQNAGQIEHLLSKLNTLIGDIEESESHGAVGVVTAAKSILKDQENATGSCSPLKHSVVASGFKGYVNYLSSRVPSTLPYIIDGDETFLLHHLDKTKKDNNVQLSVELRSKSCHCLKGIDIKSVQIGGKRHAMMTKFTLEYYDGGWNYIHNPDGKMKLFSVAGQLAHDSMVPFHRRIYTTALRVFPQEWMRLPWVRVQPVDCG